MCWGCVEKDFDELQIKAALKNESVREVAALIQNFYTLPECDMGGPLHIVIDDTNVDDHSLEFAADELLAGHPTIVVEKGRAILSALRDLNHCQRAVATVYSERKQYGY